MSSSLGRIRAIARTTFIELARLRVFYSVLAKPVHRFEYMLGKFFGVLGLLVISLVAMSILCLAVIHLREGAAVRETMQQLAQSPSEELDHALVGVHQAGANRDLV